MPDDATRFPDRTERFDRIETRIDNLTRRFDGDLLPRLDAVLRRLGTSRFSAETGLSEGALPIARFRILARREKAARRQRMATFLLLCGLSRRAATPPTGPSSPDPHPHRKLNLW